MFLGLLATGLLGYSIIQFFFLRINTHPLIKAAGGFVIGYTAMGGIIRVVSIFVGHDLVFWVTIATATLLSFLGLSRNDLREDRSTDSQSDFRFAFGAGVFLLLFFLAFIGENWVGEGPKQYSYFIKTIRNSGEFSRFPIIAQHYEEILYAYFLTSFAELNFEPIIPMWFVLGLNKVSVFALIYCLFLKLGLSRPLGLLGVSFLFFSTNHINFLRYTWLFDSNNPIGFVIHSGRINGVAIGILIVVLLCESLQNKRDTFKANYFMSIMGLGIPLSSLSNTTGLLALMATTSLGKCLSQLNSKLSTASLTFTLMVLSLSSLALSMFAYSKSGSAMNGVPLLAPILFAVFYLFYFAARSRFANSNFKMATILLMVSFLIPALITLLYLGNIFSYNPNSSNFYRWLNSNNESAQIVQFNPFANVKGAGVTLKNMSLFGDCREPSGYNETAKKFFKYYGLFFIIVALSAYASLRSKMREVELRNYLIVLTGIVALIPLLLWHTDFVCNAERSWIKTRFMEVPYYSGLFIAFYMCMQTKERWVKNASLIFFFTYTVGPLIGTRYVWFISQNFKLLLQLIKAS